MENVKTKPDLQDLTGTGAGEPEPGHDDWVRREVETTLTRKARGEMVYTDFDAVVREFDPDAH